jgi:response regulator NasT
MVSDDSKLRVVLVDDDSQRLSMVEQALVAAGHSIIARLDTHADLLFAVKQHRPDIVCISVDAPDRMLFETLHELNQSAPRPVVLFSARSDAQTTRHALEAGVSVYVVDGLHLKRLNTLLQVAIARFDLYHDLRQELDQARTRLADTRDIEKAKGLIMKTRRLDEAAAYGLLRKMAMERKQRIGDLARVLLSASELLVTEDHSAGSS